MDSPKHDDQRGLSLQFAAAGDQDDGCLGSWMGRLALAGGSRRSSDLLDQGGTDKNNRGCGDHDLDVLEIVSSVHLRTALGLVDGVELVVEVDEPPLP